MATTKARTAVVPLLDPFTVDDDVNAAVETLEASGFVAQSVSFIETKDVQGIPRRIALVHCVHQDYAGVGMLTADAAGRARMAAGYFGAGVAASAAHFADDFWTNSLIGKFANNLFAAADASRAKFAAGFFGLTATALALFADAFWAATDAARNKFADGFWAGSAALGKFADLFLTDAKLAQDRGKTAGLMIGGITPSTDITAGAAVKAVQVNIDGAGLSNIQVTVAGLNTGALIAAALQVALRAVGAGGYTLAEVRFDVASGRYLIASGTRGSTSSVATAAGLADDVGAALCLLTANGSVAIAGCNNLDHARAQAALVLGSQAADTAHLKTGALAASAAGRGKFAADFFGAGDATSLAIFENAFWAATDAARGKFAAAFLGATAVGRALMAANYFGNAELLTKFAAGARPGRSRGLPMQNHLHVGAVAATETDTFVIGANTFEMRDSTPPAGGTAGRIWIYKGLNVAEQRTNSADAVNGVSDANRITYDGAVTETFRASVDGLGTRIVSADAPGGNPVPSTVATACSQTLTPVTDIWHSATCYGGRAESQQHSKTTITVNADMITHGMLSVEPDFTPTGCQVTDRSRAHSAAYAIVGNRIEITLAGGISPDIQANDVIDVEAWA